MNHEIIASTINKEDYPFYSTMKKVMYSFDDVREVNKKTILKYLPLLMIIYLS